MYLRSKVASGRCRWWSSVVLVIALAPIMALYLVWLPLTCMGKVKAADVPENEAFGRPSEANADKALEQEGNMERESEDMKMSISEVCGVSGPGGLTGGVSGGSGTAVKYTAEGVQQAVQAEAHTETLHTIPV